MVTRDNDEIRVLNVRFGQHSVQGGKNPVDIRQNSNGLRHTTSLPFWHAHPLAGRRARKRDAHRAAMRVMWEGEMARFSVRDGAPGWVPLTGLFGTVAVSVSAAQRSGYE